MRMSNWKLSCLYVRQYLIRQANVRINQDSETNVMHFLFSLLRIKGLYMFPALLSHPQEALYIALGILLACCVSWLHQDWSQYRTYR
jgi:hypothetical protein